MEEYIPCHKLPSPGPSTEHPQDSSKINIDAHAPNSTHGVDTSPQKPLEDQMLERLIRMLEDLRHERQNGGMPISQTRTNPNSNLHVDMGPRTLPSRRTQEPFKPTFFGMTKQPLAVPQYHQGKMFPALPTRPLFNILQETRITNRSFPKTRMGTNAEKMHASSRCTMQNPGCKMLT